MELRSTSKGTRVGNGGTAQLSNLRETTNGDLDYVDGYDEVPVEMQEKIKRALDQGHIDDEDWKGDVEYNRPGQKGMRKPAPRKKKGADDLTSGKDDSDEAETSPQKASKKRGRARKEVGDDEEPTPKKVKAAPKEGKKGDDVEEPAPKTTKAAAKKAKKDETNGHEPALKKTRTTTRK
ncbi:MAG: hypothetical protein M1835_003247, partial [Candelina submexicana]